jgi:hypothetical protein
MLTRVFRAANVGRAERLYMLDLKEAKAMLVSLSS